MGNVSAKAIDHETLQNSNLASDPVCVLGAVSDSLIMILPSDHHNSIDEIFEAFKGALIIRDGAVEIEDPILEAALVKSTDEIVFGSCDEALKSLDNANALTQILKRKSPKSVVVIGSGCLINLATYAVASQERIISLTLIPSNAMSIADVAFGGLGLINYKSKNDVRNNVDPDLIILSRGVFSAAPRTQQEDGQIEVVKHLFFQKTGSNDEQISSLLSPHRTHTSDALFESSALGLKLNILLRYGIRSGQEATGNVLTFGHSHAHVLEKKSDYKLAHSEAVRFGMAVDCAFTRPDLTELLREKDEWSPLLICTVGKLLENNDLLDLSIYDSKYLQENNIRCLHPHYRAFPFNVTSSYVSVRAVSEKMKVLIQ